jgi:enoyl-CoA hydratase
MTDRELMILTRSGPTLVITFNRPEVRNAVDLAVAEGLVEVLGLLESDDQLAVGTLRGTGQTFCAGMDLRAFADAHPQEGANR